jgi:glycosyltransferase involved in cell wall biosynthesis
MNYCLLTWDYYEKLNNESFNSKIPLSGLFNWCKVFNGVMDFPRTSEEFDNYDIVHINITQKNLPLLSKIIPKINRNKTKILANVDYAVELWSSAFHHPTLLFQELDKCDYIFSVESLGASVLEDNLKRDIPIIPHPVDVKSISELRTTERFLRVTAINHSYDNCYMQAFLSMNSLPESYVTAIVGAGDIAQNVLHLFDEVQMRLSFDQMLEYLSKSYCIVDPYSVHSYGRTTIEAAALGVPCIGSHNIESMRVLFTDLIADCNNPISIKNLLEYIINDSKFYTEVCKKAILNAEYYSLESSYQRMSNFFNLKK